MHVLTLCGRVLERMCSIPYETNVDCEVERVNCELQINYTANIAIGVNFCEWIMNAKVNDK